MLFMHNLVVVLKLILRLLFLCRLPNRFSKASQASSVVQDPRSRIKSLRLGMSKNKAMGKGRKGKDSGNLHGFWHELRNNI